MAKIKILIVEDEANIVELVRYNLEIQGFQVVAAFDGKRGTDLALSEKPDLILLDLMLPEVDGLEVCKCLSENYKTHGIPIIMLTAKTEEADIVLGLEIGADDYVSKPFSPRQLAARIRAVLRRTKPGPAERLIRSGAVEMDTVKHMTRVNGTKIDLTFKEYALLKFLMESNGRVLSRDVILEQVWGSDDSLNVETRVVDKHVGELRRKLGIEGGMIVTVKNFGYRFCEELDEAFI